MTPRRFSCERERAAAVSGVIRSAAKDPVGRIHFAR